MRATSVRAERISGGTTKIEISATKPSDNSAPRRANSQSSVRRAHHVRAAVATPPPTSNVPTTARHQTRITLRVAITSERDANCLQKFAQNGFGLFATPE